MQVLEEETFFTALEGSNDREGMAMETMGLAKLQYHNGVCIATSNRALA